MDTSSIIMILVGVVAAYLIIKFIINPIFKIISGIVMILAIIYVLQNFFNVDLNKYLGPLSPYLDLNKLTGFINGIVGRISPLINLLIKR